MRVADYIFKTLADQGVKHVFLVTGGGAMFLNNGLLHEKRIRPVCCHNEAGAAIAAEGSTRLTGRLAVVSVTTGPGGTNAMTGLIGQWLDSQPVLYISGQVKFPTTTASQPELKLRQLGDQEINIVDMVRPVTKYAAMVTDPAQIGIALAKAIHLATTGRKGPVWLDIPIDVQSAEIDESRLPQWHEEFPARPVAAEEIVRQTADKLAAAHAPVLIAGHGIRLAGMQEIFRQLADRLQIPVLTTFNGFDLFPSDDPLMIGRIGTIGTRAGNIALQNADCVLSLGSRNNIRQVSYNYENFVAKAKDFICVDIDDAELQKHTIRPTLKICADLADFLPALLAKLPDFRQQPPRSRWLAWCQERKARYGKLPDARRNCPGGFDPYCFTEEMTRLLPEGAVVACANATPSLALFQSGIIKAHQRHFCNSGCAAMGYGLPAALGAAVAARETGSTPVICLEGDGSLMMNLQELQTIAAHKLPVKLFLYDNNEYCSIRQTHDNFFHERIGCDSASGVTFPDWEKVAAAFDWCYVRLATKEDLQKLPELLTSPEAVFCDVILTPDYTFEPKLSSRRLPDGKLVSPSLEDMYPFLSREEMQNNRYCEA